MLAWIKQRITSNLISQDLQTERQKKNVQPIQRHELKIILSELKILLIFNI